MAEPGRGMGRGLAMLAALKKVQESSPEDTPVASTATTPAASVVSPSSNAPVIGGRGRALLVLSKMKERPGAVNITPASDVNPSLPAPTARGVGRGMKILENLKQAQSKTVDIAAQGDVVNKVKEMSIGDKPVPQGKNKYFREIKDSPPVVKKGEAGEAVQVTANFIYLQAKENNVYEYDVAFDPQQDYKGMRMKLLNEHRDVIKVKTFDGTTLYIPTRLPDEVTILKSINPNDNSSVEIKVTYRRARRLSEMIHIYNVLLKQIMRDLELIRFGRQHFNERSAIQIPQHKLEVWPGYVTAVDEYEGGLMLTLDSTHRVLRSQSVLSYIKEQVDKRQLNWKESLLGCSVMTTYNKKLLRVDEVDDRMNPLSTFEMSNGEKISFVDYYKTHYGIEIVDLYQPLLISRQTKRIPGSEKPTEFMICLVPELCQLTGLTDEMRADFRLMKDIATYTRITPNQRHHAFKQFINNVMENDNAKQRLANWGLTIAPETIRITARTLPPETLYFGRNIKVKGSPKAEWNNDATRNPVMQAVDILKWVILYTKRDSKCTQDFVDTILRCSGPMGIHVEQPNMVMLQSDRTDAYANALKKSLDQSIQLVVCICPSSRDDRYAMIKKICCADNPVPSQVINARTIMNQQKIRAIVQKIALQINCKLGGTLWSISIPFKSAMVIGIDSYHEAGRKNRSVCAFVASYNQVFTHWYSKVCFQQQGQEIVDGLKACLVDSLRHYFNVNGRFPDRIIIYRDGVGDGQLKLVTEYEVPQFEMCFAMVEPNYKPSLTFIVVQKRINTRIFLTLNGAQLENPPPGTVVDHDITRRDWYDFLIVSQKVNQGTVTPSHYIVVHDTSGMSPDQCQRLTYKMCHLYYNWPGTVRVPAPCQYAHKLAFLVGQSIHQEHSDLLADKLFFL